MSNKVLEYIIRARDMTKSGLKSARTRIAREAKAIAKNLAHIQSGFEMTAAGIRAVGGALWKTLKESFKFETLTTQFSVLMGSMDKAKARMAELADFAAKTPFGMEEAVVASRQLHVFTGGAMGAADSLMLVGDAAAAVGQPLKDVAFWIGRAYSMIKGGQPFGEAAMRLQEMGIMTPEVRRRMEELQEAGASNVEVWQVLAERLREFTGGMEQLSKTGDGLLATLEDDWTAAVRTFGDAFQVAAKTHIQTLIDKLGELQENGDIAVWADRAVKAIETVAESAKAAGKALSWLYTRSGLSDTLGTVKGIARGAGTLAGGGGWREAVAAYGSGKAEGYWGGKLREALGDPLGGLAKNAKEAANQAERETEIRKRATEKAKQEEDLKKATSGGKEEAKKPQSLDERIAADLAKAQKAGDSGAAKRAKEVEAAYSKQFDKTADRLSRANAAAEQAFEWYKDPEAFKAQLEKEREDADAEAQFQRDFEWL
ncbi:MAG TPA: hypothetical protein PLZ60_06580, partial [Kiritimatiellia bacterium]|nr:hypothetical protein [Kiritimatiellia bacterium]